MQATSRQFAGHSSHGVLQGCVGAVDGFLARITTPSTKEVGNVKSFFSGHYQDYGLNVQACCDVNLRFNYFAVAAPGGTNDVVAFANTQLQNLIEIFHQGILSLLIMRMSPRNISLRPFLGHSITTRARVHAISSVHSCA